MEKKNPPTRISPYRPPNQLLTTILTWEKCVKRPAHKTYRSRDMHTSDKTFHDPLSHAVWESGNSHTCNYLFLYFKNNFFIFLYFYIFYIFKLFWCADFKNNF